MSEHDDIQLDEETLRQIEEEAMREAQAQLEAEGALDQPADVDEPAPQPEAPAPPRRKAASVRKAQPRPVQNEPEEDEDDYDEDYEDDDEDDFADEEEAYQPKSSIELLEVEMAKKSGRLKVSIIIMVGVLILGGIGAGLIIMINKKRAEDAANVEPIKVGPRGKAAPDNSQNDREARILLSKIRQLAGRKRVVATQIEDGLKFVEKIRKEYPEFSKKNAETIAKAETTLKDKQKRLQEMMNMGK